MKSSNGSALTYTLFGESHSAAVGITIEGIPPGSMFDFTDIDIQLQLRSGNATFNTPRKETISYEIISGFFEEKTTGTPMTILFRNQNTRSKDYHILVTQPRPGHADFVAGKKYHNAQDYRGGGHFSGRLTTPLVFLGALTRQLIQQRYPDFSIDSHIAAFAGIADVSYYDLRTAAITGLNKEAQTICDGAFFLNNPNAAAFIKSFQSELAGITKMLQNTDKSFPLLNTSLEMKMVEKAIEARNNHDSLGGIIETIVSNPPIALGEPFFHSVESVLAGMLFSVGTVKAVEFGYGGAFVDAYGSNVKDEIIAVDCDKALTLFNYNGGINGGITNGEAIVVRAILKPIASIMQPQFTYHMETNQVEKLKINGRHDAAIINRVIPVIDAVIAIALYDLILLRKLQEVDLHG